MSKIVPKLNLNKTPQSVDNNSLVFAKNIKLLPDNTIGPDNSLKSVETKESTVKTKVVETKTTSEEKQYGATIVNPKFYSYNGIITISSENNSYTEVESDSEKFDKEVGFDYSEHSVYKYSEGGFEGKSNILYNIPYGNKVGVYFHYFQVSHDDFIENSQSFDDIKTFDRNIYLSYDEKINQYYTHLYVNNKNEVVFDNITDEKLVKFYLRLFLKKGVYDADYYYILIPQYYKENTDVSVLKNYEYNEDIFLNLDGTEYNVINPVYKTYEIEIITIITRTLETETVPIKYINQIVGLDNTIFFIKESLYIKGDIPIRFDSQNSTTLNYIKSLAGQSTIRYRKESTDSYTTLSSTNPYQNNTAAQFDIDENGYIILQGNLLENSILSSLIYPNENDRIKIFKYNELADSFEILKCGWKYSGGEITGCVFKNNTNESILTICEYGSKIDNLDIPIKHINLNTCNETDDESIYTQNPNIPITNLTLAGTYGAPIPAGVYQFFIRYKINDYNYTPWMLCSKELFAGTKKSVLTLQGQLDYVDKHSNSSESFIFNVEHLYPEYKLIYSKYQLGFILAQNDDSIIAREWKEFDFSNDSVYFYVDKNNVKDANIDDFLQNSFELFNVGNVANYKNKLYISNFKETNFNPVLTYTENDEIKEYSKEINIKIRSAKVFSDEVSTYINDRLLIGSGNNFTHVDTEELKINTLFGKNYINDIVVDTGYVNGAYRDNGFKRLHRGTFIDSNFPNQSNKFYPCKQYYLYNKSDFEQSYKNCDTSKVEILGVCLNISTTLQDEEYYSVFDDPLTDIYTDESKIDYIKDYVSLIDVGDKTDIYDKVVDAGLDIVKDKITHIQKDTSNNTYNWYVKNTNNESKKLTSFYIIYSRITKYLTDEIKKEDGYYMVWMEDWQYNNVTHGQIITQYPYFIQANLLQFPHSSIYRKKYRTFKTTNVIKVNIDFDNGIIRTESNNKNYPTLLPFTNYDFFIHYVKQNGVATNGYKINNNPIVINKYRAQQNYFGLDYDPESGIDYKLVSGDEYQESLNVLTDDTFANTDDNKVYEPSPIVYNRHTNILELVDDFILYPRFSNIKKPEGYVGCFFSIKKTNNNVAQLFNISVISGTTTDTIIASCMEIDTLLYPQFDKLSIYKSDGTLVTNNASYYDSGDVRRLDTFGKHGCIKFTMASGHNITSDSILWLVIKTDEVNDRLTKLTPYIKLEDTPVIFNNYNDLNGIGFTPSVRKLINSDNKYISGDTIYNITHTDETSLIDISITEIDENDMDDAYRLKYTNSAVTIKSNFNLDYLTLTQDLSPKYKTIGTGNDKHSKLYYSVDSLISSEIYQLQSFYKDYSRKLYDKVDKTKFVVFNNVVRSSNTIEDEEYNTFKFIGTDYYTIPTTRGKIVNLISIANGIYVHCEHSLYKFSDNKTLQGDNEEITLQENDVFNTGVIELFDAQHGYAGLSNKEHSAIMFKAYVFYDSISNIIYAYTGEQQITPISEPIKKIMNTFKPNDVKIVADEYNDRFFINLIKGDDNICLSYNVNAKSFISIHDINFKFGFHSRNNVYFVAEKLDNTYQQISWSIYKQVDYITTYTSSGNNIQEHKNYTVYGNCYKKSYINISDMATISTTDDTTTVESCIDVIINNEYEKIKVIEYLNWICSEIVDYDFDANNTAEEQLNRDYPGDKLKIYTDSTSTELISLLDGNQAKRSNDQRNIQTTGNANNIGDIIANPNNWKYPTYNCGIWSFNYFRDVKNNTDIFDYKNAGNNLNLIGNANRNYYTQDSSLIYGKYFVIRFIFNNRNFKFENIVFKMTDYGKTK